MLRSISRPSARFFIAPTSASVRASVDFRFCSSCARAAAVLDALDAVAAMDAAELVGANRNTDDVELWVAGAVCSRDTVELGVADADPDKDVAELGVADADANRDVVEAEFTDAGCTLRPSGVVLSLLDTAKVLAVVSLSRRACAAVSRDVGVFPKGAAIRPVPKGLAMPL